MNHFRRTTKPGKSSVFILFHREFASNVARSEWNSMAMNFFWVLNECLRPIKRDLVFNCRDNKVLNGVLNDGVPYHIMIIWMYMEVCNIDMGKSLGKYL